MKTFYDKRGKYDATLVGGIDKVEGRVIWKTKTHWLIYVSKDDYYNAFISDLQQKDNYHTTLIGYIVIPKGVIIHSCYLATGFWDGLKQLYRSGLGDYPNKSKGAFPEELL